MTIESLNDVAVDQDATHFVNCKGHISIKNSLFENMLDDATNIHGTYLKISRSIDPKTIGVHAVHHQQNMHRWVAPGDTILIRNNKTLEFYKELVVKEFRVINHRYAEIKFYNETDQILPDSGVENPYWNPSFTMENCTVQNNRASSILLSSNREILIENNKFIRPVMASISIAGDMNYRFEPGNVNDITIRNNHFLDGSTGNFDQAIITFDPMILHPELGEKPFHCNVVIENNLVETFDNPVLDIFSASNLSFTNNTIRRINTFEREGTDELHIDEQSANSFLKENNDKLIVKSIIN
ncbi:MAG: right-handed parallel beta-helix repeat-containing protein [Bacteroidales bacterium]